MPTKPTKPLAWVGIRDQVRKYPAALAAVVGAAAPLSPVAGAPSHRWTDADLRHLGRVPDWLDAFEKQRWRRLLR